MMYNFLVILHLLGSATWIGGHVVLVRVVLPAALRENDPRRVTEFETGFSKIGLAAIVIQIVTGLFLAKHRFGTWGDIFTQSTQASHLVLTKLALLGITFAIAADASLRILPRLDQSKMRAFVLHAWATTILAILMLVAGAAVRLGGLF